MVEKIIKKALQQALSALDIPAGDIHLEHPADEKFGDFSTNVALAAQGNPRELAQQIVAELEKDRALKDTVSVLEIAGPGFINFRLSQQYLLDSLANMLEKGAAYGSSDRGSGTRIITEFGQPNTHKLPHIGHLRSYLTGEAIARLFAFSGYTVYRVNYQGDVGMHVAKCLWGYQKKGFDTQNHNADEDLLLHIQQLQESYQYGSKAYEEDPEAKKEIDVLNKKIYEKDPDVYDLWKQTREWSLAHYAHMHEQLDIAYDRQYYESDVADEAVSLVKKHTGSVFEESDGAIIFRGEKFGLHNRVFLSSAGNPMYEAKDLALAFKKEQDFTFDQTYISTSTEQIEYFKVVYKAVEQIDKTVAGKFTHIPFGMVSLKGRKLSSREGTIVSIDDYIHQFSIAYEKAGFESNIENEDHHTVILGALKYSMLTTAVNQNIVCDIEKSIQLQGNTGPYLQYTYARCRSVLSKGGEQNNFDAIDMQPEEVSLLRTLDRFPEIVAEATRKRSPHFVSTYLFDLAQKYNLFYQKVPILKSSEEEKRFRLALTEATSIVLKNGLNLLGIQTLEKM